MDVVGYLSESGNGAPQKSPVNTSPPIFHLNISQSLVPSKASSILLSLLSISLNAGGWFSVMEGKATEALDLTSFIFWSNSFWFVALPAFNTSTFPSIYDFTALPLW